MKWVAVPAMHLKPYRCLACGSTPRDDEVEGRPNMQAYFCEGVDMNYGDSVFLCGNCVRVLGELRGMVSVKDHERLKKAHEELKYTHGELKEELTELRARVERMLDGVKAKKQIQATRPKRKAA